MAPEPESRGGAADDGRHPLLSGSRTPTAGTPGPDERSSSRGRDWSAPGIRHSMALTGTHFQPPGRSCCRIRRRWKSASMLKRACELEHEVDLPKRVGLAGLELGVAADGVDPHLEGLLEKAPGVTVVSIFPSGGKPRVEHRSWKPSSRRLASLRPSRILTSAYCDIGETAHENHAPARQDLPSDRPRSATTSAVR